MLKSSEMYKTRGIVLNLSTCMIICTMLTGYALSLHNRKAPRVLQNDYCAIALDISITPSIQPIDSFERENQKILKGLGHNNLSLSKTLV